MKIGLVVLGVIILLALVLGGGLIGSRNDLVTEREAVKAALAQVDTVLQRRNDLIPNLVETVKGIAKQELAVVDSVTKARAAMIGAQTPSEKVAADQQLSGALSRLLVVVENYPQLKSDQNFLRLQDELAGTENRIGVARRRYNDALRDYNTFVRQFPNSIWAGMLGFRVNDAYFEASAASRTVPNVKF